MEIVSNVHHIPDIIANPFLIIDPDGLTLIDAGLARNDGKVLKYIAQLGYAPSDLKRVIITHADGDHVGSLAALKAATGAHVYASSIEAAAIEAGRSSRELKGGGVQRLLFRLAAPFFRAKPAKVDEIIADGQVLPILGGLQVIDTAGHTPGHVSLYAPSAKILFAGDSMVAESDGQLRTSRGGNTWDEAKAIESTRTQAALGAQIVCCGHGPVVRDAAGKFPTTN